MLIAQSGQDKQHKNESIVLKEWFEKVTKSFTRVLALLLLHIPSSENQDCLLTFIVGTLLQLTN